MLLPVAVVVLLPVRVHSLSMSEPSGVGVPTGVGVGSISCSVGVAVGVGVTVGADAVAVGVGVAGLVGVGGIWRAVWTAGVTVATGGGVGVLVGVAVGLGFPPHPVSESSSSTIVISTMGSTSLTGRARYTFIDTLLLRVGRGYLKLAELSNHELILACPAGLDRFW